MAHPYAKNMDDKAGAARAKQITRGYAKGGRVNVNINMVPRSDPSPAPVPPLPPVPPGAGPLPPMGAPAPGPMGKPPGMASGGKVGMTAGAESGEGRLQKARKYGKRARSG